MADFSHSAICFPYVWQHFVVHILHSVFIYVQLIFVMKCLNSFLISFCVYSKGVFLVVIVGSALDTLKLQP